MMFALPLLVARCGEADLRPVAEEFRQSWFHASPVQGGIRVAPTVIGDSLVLFAAGGRVNAVDLQTGEEIWSSAVVSPAGEVIGAEFVESNGVILVMHASQVIALSREDGTTLWRFERRLPGRLYMGGYGAVIDDTYFASGRDGYAYRLNIFTGELTDERVLPEIARSYEEYDGNLVVSETWRDSTGAFFGAIHALDVDSFETVWRTITDRGSFSATRPLIVDDVVVAGLQEGVSGVVAVSARDGELLWETPSFPVHTITALSDGVFVNDGARIRKIDFATGELLWTTDFGFGSDLSPRVAFLDGLVYHPHAGVMMVLDSSSGEIVYSEILADGYAMQVSVSAGMVFVQTTKGLAAYEPLNRDLL